jgi:histidinol-phosphate aminotransferase
MSEYLRPHLRALSGYAPGEQPRDGSYLKLNTNENPYPPSPRVFDALRAAMTTERLRKYPDPLGTAFRRTAARVLDVDPESILIGNGSDDSLTMITRAFVPEGGRVVAPTPSYTLYRTLSELQGASFEVVPYTRTWTLPQPWPAKGRSLTFVANPNSPSGTAVGTEALEELAESLEGPLVIDEAYADFADANALPLARRENVIVTRSLSKSYALAGVRFGYAVARPELIRELVKVKDSYNCDALSLAAAEAALADQAYLQATRAKIIASRSRLAAALAKLGFAVCPSQANFVWCRRNDRPVRPIYEELKRRMILVRYMRYEGYGDGLRISIGADAEMDRLVGELRQIV